MMTNLFVLMDLVWILETCLWSGLQREFQAIANYFKGKINLKIVLQIWYLIFPDVFNSLFLPLPSSVM